MRENHVRMQKNRFFFIVALQFACAQLAFSQTMNQVIDLPTRPGVTQRFLYIAPAKAKASAILFAGGHGGLQISTEGDLAWGSGNFVVRTRQQLVDRGIAVAVLDAPSDRQTPPYLNGFRQTPEHLEDVKAVIAWLKAKQALPVWLVATSRGTQSAAYIASQVSPEQGGPDGLVLTSAILSDPKSRALPQMDLGKLSVPVLVVDHQLDGCKHCADSYLPSLMEQLQYSQ